MGCTKSTPSGTFHTSGRPSERVGGDEVVFGNGVHVGRSGNVNLSGRKLTYLDGGLVQNILNDEMQRTATSLQLNNNQLYTLGKELLALSHIEQIDLEENSFQRVPEILTQIPPLWRINISANPVTATSFGVLPRIQNLKSIALRRCQLKSIPDPILRCVLLEELDVSQNSKISLSTSLATLRNLHSLYMSECDLEGSTLPVGILNLPALQQLDISSNQFSFERAEFFGKKIPVTLHTLQLRDLNLYAVPQSVASLTKLHTLDLAQNPIVTLDVLAGRLIRRLSRSANGSLYLPNGSVGKDSTSDSGVVSLSKVSKIGRITNIEQPVPLKRLSLRACGLRTVPKYFHKLSSLEELDLSENVELDDPDMTLFSLENLKALNVVACPFADDPSKSRNEWYDIGKLRNLTHLDWEIWKEASNVSAYRTRIPIEICGLPLQWVNEVPLRKNLFVPDTIETIINVLQDGYFKVDVAMDDATVYGYIEALKLFDCYKRFFYPNDEVQLRALESEIKDKEDRYAVAELLSDIGTQRLRVAASRYIFFLTVQAANYDAVIVPPLDVMILHYGHVVTHPAEYRADCEAICGRILNCNYRHLFYDIVRFGPAAKEQVLAGRKVWNLMARTTSQEGMPWLHYDFWTKRSKNATPTPSSMSDMSGIRGLPCELFTSRAAIKQESMDLRRLHTARDLGSMLDPAITTHFDEKGLDEAQSSIEELFLSCHCFLDSEEKIRALSLDWPRYVKFLALCAVHATAPKPSEQKEPEIPTFAPRRNTSLLGKRYDEREEDVGLDEIDPQMRQRKPSMLTKRRNALAVAHGALTSNPVPTIGLTYLLHAHRTAHVKYFQILSLFGLEACDVTWEDTKKAADGTVKAWEALYDETYVGPVRPIFCHEVLNSGFSNDRGQLVDAMQSTVCYKPDAYPRKSALLARTDNRGKKRVTLLLGDKIM